MPSPLYHPLLLEHNRAPLFFEKRPEAACVIDAYNPICGDKFKLYLDVEEGKIVRASFHGYGCAVSKASASVLMSKLQGLALTALPDLWADFFALMGQTELPAAGIVRLSTAEQEALGAAKDFPGRMKCATLCWDALREMRF